MICLSVGYLNPFNFQSLFLHSRTSWFAKDKLLNKPARKKANESIRNINAFKFHFHSAWDTKRKSKRTIYFLKINVFDRFATSNMVVAYVDSTFPPLGVNFAHDTQLARTAASPKCRCLFALQCINFLERSRTKWTRRWWLGEAYTLPHTISWIAELIFEVITWDCA